MRIIKAAFSKTFPISQYYEKIYLEAELNEGDDTRKSLYELKKQVQDFFYESNAAMEKQMGTHTKEFTLINSEGVGTIEDHISSCTELKVLESYRLMVKGVPGLQKLYDKKLEELKVSS